MKVGIFTDSHYSSADVTCEIRYNNKSLEKIRKAYEYFKAEKCEMVICLGDLIDHEKEHSKEIENLKKVKAVLDDYDIKTIVVMGNHDGFSFEVEEFYEILGKDRYPNDVHKDKTNLLFIDACYFRNGVHYMPGDEAWDNTFYPYPDELQERLEKADGDVYIFVHQNIDGTIREDHRLFNSADLRKMFEENGKVKTVFQGHYHPGHQSEINGISYRTFPAMCEREDAYFIIEL